MSERARRSSRSRRLRAVAAHEVGIDARIRREHGEAEAPRAPADGLADAAETDDAEREAGQAPEAPHLVPAPVVRALHLAVVSAQAALARQHQRERVVRDLVRAVLADGRDPDAAGMRRPRRRRNPSLSPPPR